MLRITQASSRLALLASTGSPSTRSTRATFSTMPLNVSNATLTSSITTSSPSITTPASDAAAPDFGALTPVDTDADLHFTPDKEYDNDADYECNEDDIEEDVEITRDGLRVDNLRLKLNRGSTKAQLNLAIATITAAELLAQLGLPLDFHVMPYRRVRRFRNIPDVFFNLPPHGPAELKLVIDDTVLPNRLDRFRNLAYSSIEDFKAWILSYKIFRQCPLPANAKHFIVHSRIEFLVDWIWSTFLQHGQYLLANPDFRMEH